MPINWGVVDTQFPQKLSDLFDPNLVRQRQTAASDQQIANQLRQAQLVEAARGIQRAPELARREDIAYGQQQEQLQAQQASALRKQKLLEQLNVPNVPPQIRQKIFTQLYPEEAAKQSFKPVEPVAAPKTREIQIGDKKVTQEWTGAEWKKVGEGPAWRETPNPLMEFKMAQQAEEKQKAIKQQSLSAQQVLDQAAELYAHPGRQTATGASSFMANIPGTEARGFKANLDTFKAQTFVPMVSALKGMGALSDAEGRKLSESVGALDPSMPEKEFAASLQKITKYLYDKAKVAGLEVQMPEFVGKQGQQAPSGVALSASEQQELDQLRARFGRK